jgi:glycerol dehydrogenase-like iron-containing ADH family enzyme
MKPAREYDIRYGHDLVKTDSAGWPPYIAITTPTAWQTAQPFLAQAPAGVGFNQWLDRTHLEAVADSLPDQVELVVGLGGGRALDHAKLVADRKGLALVQVPTIVSTGAIIHGFCGNWSGRQMNGFACEVDAEYVLVDYDLVKQAPEHLNTAGIGDVLCGYAGLSEWRYKTERGIGPPFDAEIARITLEHHADIVENFPRTLGPAGSLSDDSVRFIMQAVQDRDDKMLRHEAAPNADHSFCFALEYVNDQFWIHGEEVALGAVIVAWNADQKPETLIDWLDRCQVRFRPQEMQISKEQLRRGLEILPQWMRDKAGGQEIDSIMIRQPVTGDHFEACWAWLSRIIIG